MLERMKKMLKKEKGFTLVELLAVIVILGIILAIAVPAIGNVISGSQEDADEANIKLIENAAKLADIDGETMPISVSNLESKGYLEEIPKVPGSDNEVYSGNVTKDDTGKFSYEKSTD